MTGIQPSVSRTRRVHRALQGSQLGTLQNVGQMRIGLYRRFVRAWQLQACDLCQARQKVPFGHTICVLPACTTSLGLKAMLFM